MEEKELGEITHYFSKIGVAVVKLSSAVKQGDKIHVKGPSTDFVQIADSMQIDHKTIPEAKKGQEIGMKMALEAREKDKIFKA